jgi:hypothetical protein
MRGKGERWRATLQLFELHAKRLGIQVSTVGEAVARARAKPDPRGRQLPLFGK